MRSQRVFLAIAVFLLSAVPSFAACTLPLTAAPLSGVAGYRLSWQPIPNVTNYQVQVSSDNFQHVTTLITLPGGTSGVTVKQLTSNPSSLYSYRIIASNPSSAFDAPCSGTFTAGFSGINLHDRVNRIVLPVVGSTPGLNNASFKSSLRLGPAPVAIVGNTIVDPALCAGRE